MTTFDNNVHQNQYEQQDHKEQCYLFDGYTIQVTRVVIVDVDIGGKGIINNGLLCC